MNARKLKRSKVKVERAKARERWKAYAQAQRDAGRPPLSFHDWLEAQGKTW